MVAEKADDHSQSFISTLLTFDAFNLTTVCLNVTNERKIDWQLEKGKKKKDVLNKNIPSQCAFSDY